jgi:putative phage-type endonuclease
LKIISLLLQGSKEWHAHRAKHFNASDAPAMMGCSKYKTRQQLIHELVTGSTKEVDSFTQQRFDRGHETEAAIRPHIELMICEDLYPVVGVSEEHPKLSASFDGLTMDNQHAFEHKLWNEALAASVESGAIADDPAYYWQMEQQILVSGCESVVFTVSDGTPEKCVTFEYEAVPGRAEQLIAGWNQLEEDMKNYQANSAAFDIQPEGNAPDQLPALRIELSGLVTASNLPQWREKAIAIFKGINKDLQTDEDFANADKTVKWCADIEERLAAAKQHALSQTQSIDELFRAVDDISAEARRVRLDLDKLIKARKEARKTEIIQEASMAFSAHIATINASIKPLVMPSIPADFAGATKQLKSFSSMKDKVNGELARAKIEASRVAALIRINQASLRELAADYTFLFADAQQIILKPNDDLNNLIKQRITDHLEAQAKKALADKIAAEVKQEEKPAPAVAVINASAGIVQAIKTVGSNPSQKRLSAALAEWAESNGLSDKQSTELAELLSRFGVNIFEIVVAA